MRRSATYAPRSRRLRILAISVLVAAAGGAAAQEAPPTWPPDAPRPAAVVDADQELRDRTRAWRTQADGLDVEIRIRPRVDLLWRDDPPRPLDASFEARPEASLVWSPLASEVLLAEARVLEAELRLQDAWRDALLQTWSAPVAASRALRDLHAAERDVVATRTTETEAREALRETLRAALENAASAMAPEQAASASDRHGATTPALEAMERALLDDPSAAPDDASSAAALDLAHAVLDAREARWAVAEARREAAPWWGYRPPGTDEAFGRGWDRLDAWRAEAAAPPPVLDAGVRSAVRLPPVPDPVSMRAYRARDARTAAVVSRAERNRRGALLPAATLQAGYAGRRAGLSTELGVRSGRPRIEVAGTLDGTVQERFWIRAGATVRWGSDLERSLSDVGRAREDRERTLRELADALRSDATSAIADAHATEERWRLAEERLKLARMEGDPRRVDRALDVARMRYLQYLTAAGRAWTRTESAPAR